MPIPKFSVSPLIETGYTFLQGTVRQCLSLPLRSLPRIYERQLDLSGLGTIRMLYLAQVQKKGFLGKGGLRLLARQRSEYTWSLIREEDLVVSIEAANLNEGVLVLVELSDARHVLAVEDATAWVLDILQKYLVTGITPAFLQQETERAEQWRQSLTLQSQELDRRALELEARREQVQALEETLKREQEKREQEKREQEKRDQEKHEQEKPDQETL